MSSPTAKTKILAALRQASVEITAAELADQMQCNPKHVAAQLKHLTDAHKVTRQIVNQIYLYQPAPRP